MMIPMSPKTKNMVHIMLYQTPWSHLQWRLPLTLQPRRLPSHNTSVFALPRIAPLPHLHTHEPQVRCLANTPAYLSIFFKSVGLAHSTRRAFWLPHAEHPAMTKLAVVLSAT